MLNALLAEITIHEEPKSPINQYKARSIRKGKKIITMMYLESKFSEYQKLFEIEARSIVNRTKQEPFTGPVRVEAKFYFGTKRIKDLQNCCKLELDALNGLIYKDDSQVHKIEMEKHYDKGDPRVELKIYQYPESDWIPA
jgi:Holliday junction resolvase RusA-like endonuclease